MDPVIFFKALADQTRLQSLLLIEHEQEMCVCELTQALQQSQPKISRHLAQLRKSEILTDRRQGQWVFYAINPALPEWARACIASALSDNPQFLATPLNNLVQMGDRPVRKANCC
ncbi:metalloregulator ArsR/SmtB family transcription factor [Motilimonas pumila]|uniref:ArsR family transcriptional regulator n=1 Tax=Motilimonas pumila TaxID=2303987 RepID=A0A418YEW6_9GAMM|nr:metalloregulator ArsR/SmtB family transcription factor [Motilimonas pumila]RJG47730.1 ArsR family transcriptional regulator [Motilimonas pumila]